MSIFKNFKGTKLFLPLAYFAYFAVVAPLNLLEAN